MPPSSLPYAPLSDLEVVQRVLNGEKQLYELLLRRHNQRLYRIGLALLHDAEAVEEAMQVTWVKAYEQLASFAGRASFATWLTRILLNECLGRLRRQQRAASLDEYAEADLPSADGATPLQLVLNDELRDALEHAVQALPDAYRSVFVLRAVEGLSVGETAEYLGLTETNVKARLSRARERLRHHLLRFDPQRTFTYLGPRCDGMVQRVWQALVW
ncbi:RNA polymerase sigma factor [Hymenobacter sp. 15J16-1T3B]|uniref:RNA polymerase sigma factor n=1 Tax=Hymenobacter sp. 15J16-1T3B TaxID=2886941 RepID=UPI001D113616|nr:RNA polymerase sigma factor [Hymenobacter sp. 15J16-1T3B]MCC3159011.1 RNA polymerase sigma factor [Hymenobacter sp. 15J16-1T3B]